MRWEASPSSPPAHRCARCGYDLTGTAGRGVPRCPECGEAQTALAVAAGREARFFREIRHLAVMFAVPSLAIACVLATTLGPGVLLYLLPAMVFLLPALTIALAAFATIRLPDEPTAACAQA